MHSSSRAELIINESDIDDVFQSIYAKIIQGRLIDSVIGHIISISKYNPLTGGNYIKLPKELDHPRKILISIQNTDDNECFKWCLAKYLNPTNYNPRRITKADKDFAKRLDFKDTKLPVKIRDIHNIEKRSQSALAFLVMKLRKNIQSMYQSNVMRSLIRT